MSEPVRLCRRDSDTSAMICNPGDVERFNKGSDHHYEELLALPADEFRALHARLAAAEARATALEKERDGWRDARRESEGVISAIAKAAGPRAEEHDIIEHVAALQARAEGAVAALRDLLAYVQTIGCDESNLAVARASLLTLLMPAPTPPATMPPVVLCEAHKGCEIDPRPFCPYCFGTAEYAAGRDERKRRDPTPPAPAPASADDEAAEIERRIGALDRRSPGYKQRLRDGLSRSSAPPAPASGEWCPACGATDPAKKWHIGSRFYSTNRGGGSTSQDWSLCPHAFHNTPPREGGKDE